MVQDQYNGIWPVKGSARRAMARRAAARFGKGVYDSTSKQEEVSRVEFGCVTVRLG